MAASNAKAKVTEQVKAFEEAKTDIDADFGDASSVLELINQLNYYRETSFVRGEKRNPILLIPTTTLQKNLEAEHLKYTTKRDPSLEEITEACQKFDPELAKLAGKYNSEGYCCQTHAVAVQALARNYKSMINQVNRAIALDLKKHLGKACPVDSVQPVSQAVTKDLLKTVMPLLNSVQLFGRYKQRFPEGTSFVTGTYASLDLGQTYSKDIVYRNP